MVDEFFDYYHFRLRVLIILEDTEASVRDSE
jgi:hypothetical protein